MARIVCFDQGKTFGQSKERSRRKRERGGRGRNTDQESSTEISRKRKEAAFSGQRRAEEFHLVGRGRRRISRSRVDRENENFSPRGGRGGGKVDREPDEGRGEGRAVATGGSKSCTKRPQQKRDLGLEGLPTLKKGVQKGSQAHKRSRRHVKRKVRAGEESRKSTDRLPQMRVTSRAVEQTF